MLAKWSSKLRLLSNAILSSSTDKTDFVDLASIFRCRFVMSDFFYSIP